MWRSPVHVGEQHRRAPRSWLLLSSKNAVLTHRLLALRHVIPNGVLAIIPSLRLRSFAISIT